MLATPPSLVLSVVHGSSRPGSFRRNRIEGGGGSSRDPGFVASPVRGSRGGSMGTNERSWISARRCVATGEI